MPGITIVGLGPGNPADLTRAAWETLTSASEIYLRTQQHPAVAGLAATLKIHAFDDLYDALDDFDALYRAIAERVLELGARPEGVVYAVPGHPAVGEATAALIREHAGSLPVRLVPGLSFVEPTLAALGLDALPGLQIADALDLGARHHPPFHPDAPAMVAQLHSRALASDVKLTLLNQYPAEHAVSLVHAAGTDQELVERLALHELDHSRFIAHLTTLLIPPLPQASALETFQNTLARLRAPDGCPWDREQTHQSLRTNLLEEAYEALQAIDADDAPAMCEEFGDLLLQIVLQSQIAVEAGEFSLAQVIAGINAKIIRRHPHVFGGVAVNGISEVLHNWEALKAAERGVNGLPEKGMLDGVPAALPALAQAYEYQSRVARVGFDWPEIGGVTAKVREEIAEIESASGAEARAAEFGDLLFAVVNWARWMKVEPESALRQANARFARRFAQVEASARAQGRALAEMTIEELDALWEGAKGVGGDLVSPLPS